MIESDESKITREAIQSKKLISFTYSDKERVIEPHVLGVSKGCIQVLGYQIRGESSGQLPEWRRFDLSKAISLRVLTETFSGPRPFPSGKHSSWDEEWEIVK